MTKYFSKLACLLLTQLVWQEKKSALHLVRIKAATCYVKGVQGARQGVIGYFGLCLIRFVLGFGFLMLHIGLLLLPALVDA